MDEQPSDYRIHDRGNVTRSKQCSPPPPCCPFRPFPLLMNFHDLLAPSSLPFFLSFRLFFPSPLSLKSRWTFFRPRWIPGGMASSSKLNSTRFSLNHPGTSLKRRGWSYTAIKSCSRNILTFEYSKFCSSYVWINVAATLTIRYNLS